MQCIFCGSELSNVIDKRAVKSSGEIRRRRECLKCHERYTTYERVCAFEMLVVKKDGKKQLFNRNKLRSGIEKSLEKRPNAGKVEEITLRIERKLKVRGKKEVLSKQIGQEVLTELKKLDPIAYLRFASVYRQFENTADFAKELKHLTK